MNKRWLGGGKKKSEQKEKHTWRHRAREVVHLGNCKSFSMAGVWYMWQNWEVRGGNGEVNRGVMMKGISN